MRLERRWRTFVLAMVVVGVLAPSTAGAAISQAAVVNPNPVNFTPNLEDDGVVKNSTVYAVAQSGDTMFVGGVFHKVTNSSRTVTYARSNFLAFSASTGAVNPMTPSFDGAVWALLANGSSLYVGGTFKNVNGVPHRALVKLNASTGAVDPTFKPGIKSGNVTEIRLVAGRLLIGGTFGGTSFAGTSSTRLAALDPTTGANTGYLALGISGSIASNAGSTRVYRFAVNPAGDRLLAIGNFTTVLGEPRRQAFMLRLGSTATLSPWHPHALDLQCTADDTPVYLRDVDFSPDGSYFVMAASGYLPRTGDVGTAVCDAASRWETADETSTARPTWINYTGGDTLHAVAVTGVTVYVQGHQRWLDNPFGRNEAGPGAVSRPGIGALNPATGKTFDWNPTKTRGVGGKDFLATSRGLWVASDGNRFKNEFRASIAFCPLP
jgi:hypothetical protein